MEVEHRLLGREVPEEGTRRNPGLLGDLLDRGRVVPLRGEELERGLTQGPFRVRFVLVSKGGSSFEGVLNQGHIPAAE